MFDDGRQATTVLIREALKKLGLPLIPGSRPPNYSAESCSVRFGHLPSGEGYFYPGCYTRRNWAACLRDDLSEPNFIPESRKKTYPEVGNCDCLLPTDSQFQFVGRQKLLDGILPIQDIDQEVLLPRRSASVKSATASRISISRGDYQSNFNVHFCSNQNNMAYGSSNEKGILIGSFSLSSSKKPTLVQTFLSENDKVCGVFIHNQDEIHLVAMIEGRRVKCKIDGCSVHISPNMGGETGGSGNFEVQFCSLGVVFPIKLRNGNSRQVCVIDFRGDVSN